MNSLINNLFLLLHLINNTIQLRAAPASQESEPRGAACEPYALDGSHVCCQKVEANSPQMRWTKANKIMGHAHGCYLPRLIPNKISIVQYIWPLGIAIAVYRGTCLPAPLYTWTSYIQTHTLPQWRIILHLALQIWWIQKSKAQIGWTGARREKPDWRCHPYMQGYGGWRDVDGHAARNEREETRELTLASMHN